MVKVTINKSLQKEIDRAKKVPEPFYKPVITHEKACPFCLAVLKHQIGQDQYSCACGTWVYSWAADRGVQHTWRYIELQPRSREALS